MAARGEASGTNRNHLHGLRNAGNVLVADGGANLRELMERMGHSTTRAALLYLHGDDEWQPQFAASVIVPDGYCGCHQFVTNALMRWPLRCPTNKHQDACHRHRCNGDEVHGPRIGTAIATATLAATIAPITRSTGLKLSYQATYAPREGSWSPAG
jgi:hypothetical protein